MSQTSTSTVLDELRIRLSGGLHHPGDPAFEDTCTLFNAMIETRPAAVARCAAPDDVAAALAAARTAGLPVAIRAGGHSVAGVSLCQDGLVIDIRQMDDVTVDPERRIARVGGGATWSQLDRATQPHGLATTGGRVSTTGVAGLTLGGGSGWLERLHGLACDSLVAAELVTADGELVRASRDQNPDLLWALRGGGGNFGVVTTLELQLHPLPDRVLAGLALYPPERSRELLELWRDTMADAPEGLSLAYVDLTVPPEDELPAELHGTRAAAIDGMYAGPVEEGEELLRELRAFGPTVDMFSPMAYADFQCMLDDPPGQRNWWTAEHLQEFSDDALDVFAQYSASLPAGSSQLLVAAWGGAVAREPEGGSPMAWRDARFVVHPFALWEDAKDDQATIGWARACRDAMRALRDRLVVPELHGRRGRRPGSRGLRGREPRAPRAHQGRVGPGRRVPRDGARGPGDTRGRCVTAAPEDDAPVIHARTYVPGAPEHPPRRPRRQRLRRPAARAVAREGAPGRRHRAPGGRSRFRGTLDSQADRARRGISGALYSQSALARLNPLSRDEAVGASPPRAVSMARVPRDVAPRTRSGPEGSSLKRYVAGAAGAPGPEPPLGESARWPRFDRGCTVH